MDIPLYVTPGGKKRILTPDGKRMVLKSILMAE
jgi:hypothetical protein